MHSALVTAKWEWLDEIVGAMKEEKEEELEGEALDEESTGNYYVLYLT